MLLIHILFVRKVTVLIFCEGHLFMQRRTFANTMIVLTLIVYYSTFKYTMFLPRHKHLKVSQNTNLLTTNETNKLTMFVTCFMAALTMLIRSRSYLSARLGAPIVGARCIQNIGRLDMVELWRKQR